MSADEEFGPVETEMGEQTRRLAIRTLSKRYYTLSTEMTERRLTRKEHEEMRGLEAILETLQGMAPVGPLMPPRTDHPEAWEAYDAQRAKPAAPGPQAAQVSYCAECDALPGECEHTGHRYLDPIRYEEISEPGAKRKMWKVPEHERERVDHPPSTWAKAEDNPPPSDPDANPFLCAFCGGPINRWRRATGHRYCSAAHSEEAVRRGQLK